jgi:hypothetical protein
VAAGPTPGNVVSPIRWLGLLDIGTSRRGDVLSGTLSGEQDTRQPALEAVRRGCAAGVAVEQSADTAASGGRRWEQEAVFFDPKALEIE